MAYIEPNTRIDFLRGIPFDPSYENTMYFDSISDQISYFDTKIAITVEKASYQRAEKGYLKVGWVVDTFGVSVINQMYNVNYMRFKNTNFENKWFYAFVDSIDYINNNTVGIHYHLDVLQTWHFDYSFNECFIERQHSTTDTLGSNTIPENFELGDYVIEGIEEVDYLPQAIVVSSGDINGDYTPGVVIDGLNSKGKTFSGVHYNIFSLNDQTQVDQLNAFLEAAYTSRDRQNSIIAVFMGAGIFMSSPKPTLSYTQYISKNDNKYRIGNHTVRNNKLMTFPYNLIYVTNYQGGHLELHYEYFSNPEEAHMKVWGSTGVNPGLILYPVNYKMTGNNFDEMLTLSGFPMCAWVNDAFKAWVAQNAATIVADFGAVAFGAISSAVTPNIQDTVRQGGIAGSIIAASKMVGKVLDHFVQPPSAHGEQNGDVLFQSGHLTFMMCNKHIREEYAEIIDDFFDMYGYAIHRKGYPNRSARPCYTYVKTSDCSMHGNVPVDDLRIIEGIFNKGVRFWRTTATFGIYDPVINNNAPI